MEAVTNSEERFYYILKNIISFILLFTDILINGIFDVLDHRQSSTSVYVLIAIQVVLRLALLFTLVLLMWDTFVFKYGLLGMLCRQFRAVFLLGLVSFIFLAAVRGVKIAATVGSKTLLDLWNDDGYYAVYILHLIGM